MKPPEPSILPMISGCEADCENRGNFSLRVKHDHVIVCSAFFAVLLSFYFGERISIGNGLGWDGQFYGALAKNWSNEIAAKPLDQYTIRRVLPSAVIHVFLRLGRFPLSDENVIRGFGLLNILCVTGAAWYWVRIASHLAIGPRGKWLGFCALFLKATNNDCDVGHEPKI